MFQANKSLHLSIATAGIAGITLLLGAVAIFVFAAASPVGAGNARIPQTVSALGVAHVDGQRVFVHVTAVVPPGADANAVARSALGAQGARPFDSTEFTTNGLVWDQFSDGSATNDFVTQYYNPNNDPTGGAGGTALTSGQSSWTNVVSSNFTFSYGGETGRCPSLVRECPGPQKFDSKNDVGWVELAGCCTLGVTWYSTSIDEADVALNTKFTWFTDGVNHFDAETVFLHEFGHVIGLGHSDVVGAVMEATYQGVRRVLHQDDKDGITFLYPAGSLNSAPTVTIVSPLNGASFGSGATILFEGTASDAEDGNITESLVWTSTIDGQIGTGGSFSKLLSDGSHSISATVTDVGGKTGSAVVLITVGPPPPSATTMSAAISYSTEGGKNGDKNLLDTITVTDNLGNPVAGASVSITLTRQQGGSWSGTGTTGTNGKVTFALRDSPSGCYTTTINSVTKQGLTWDGISPTNQFCK